MSPQSLASAGQLLVILPAVMFGGLSVLTLLIRDPRFSHLPARRIVLVRAQPTATKPNALIYLANVGAVSLTIGLVVLGIGLLGS